MSYIHNNKIEFEHIRNNQLELLRKMVEKSVLKTTIRYLNMGLENNHSTKAEYHQEECIENIRVSHKNIERKLELKITWARKITQNMARITCTPIIKQNLTDNNNLDSNIYIPTLHKTTQYMCDNLLPKMQAKPM